MSWINLFSIVLIASLLGCFICISLIAAISVLIDKRKEKNEPDLPDNNLVEFVWEDADGNGIYKIK